MPIDRGRTRQGASGHGALSGAEDRLARAQAARPGGGLGPLLEERSLGRYRGYAELLSTLGDLSRRGARLSIIGDSVEGEPIAAVEFGADTARRTSIILSGIHPMEWIGVETHLALLLRLAENPPTDRRVVSIVLVNPDGYLAVENNLRVGRRRVLRHNRHRVDLNRNFPAFWGRFSFARLLLPFIFRPGNAPASEPEVKAIINATRHRIIDRALSLHSFGGVVLHPYGAKWRAPIDAAEHRKWAGHIAAHAHPRRYRVLQPSHWIPGFTAPGMELDYFHDAHGALSLLVECSRGGIRGKLSSLVEPFAWFNPCDPEHHAERIARAVEPFVRGRPRPGT